jgi:hypothetical protein
MHPAIIAAQSAAIAKLLVRTTGLVIFKKPTSTVGKR